MITLPSPPIITEDGVPNVFQVHPGKEYLFILNGDFSGGEALLKYPDMSGSWKRVTGDGWTEAAEARFVAPSSSMTIELNGSVSPAVEVSVIPII